ncbi:MAG TPA: hypothetical protein VJ780_08390, partial [Flavobacterium sp.]|nr:hypothetical protein [Flavobacterium sp.]
IHESFTNYSESLFLEYYYGKNTASEYIIGTRNGIANDFPIIGKYDVNDKGSGDMYSKGGNMLHTLRQIVNDDKKWRNILRGLNSTFYHQTVTSKQIEDYLSEQAGIDLNPFFNQYLRDTRIPVLEYYFNDGQFVYNWTNCVANFDLPIKLNVDGVEKWIKPQTDKKTDSAITENSKIQFDNNFYISTKLLQNK